MEDRRLQRFRVNLWKSSTKSSLLWDIDINPVLCSQSPLAYQGWQFLLPIKSKLNVYILTRGRFVTAYMNTFTYKYRYHGRFYVGKARTFFWNHRNYGWFIHSILTSTTTDSPLQTILHIHSHPGLVASLAEGRLIFTCITATYHIWPRHYHVPTSLRLIFKTKPIVSPSQEFSSWVKYPTTFRNTAGWGKINWTPSVLYLS